MVQTWSTHEGSLVAMLGAPPGGILVNPDFQTQSLLVVFEGVSAFLDGRCA